MRKGAYSAILAIFMGLVVPVILLLLPRDAERVIPPETVPEIQEQKITVIFEDETREMNLEDYIMGVVTAEMPSSFEKEALKAQAVVARTYALRRMEGESKHENGDVCVSSACCQGYTSPERENAVNREKIRSAVMQTEGLVLTYEGKLIDATYFSCSGGSTEDAVAVWGSDIPYLQSTDSPGEEQSYYREVFFPMEEFAERLGIDPDTWYAIGLITYTEGGGVDRMEIGDGIFSGTEIRSLLDLPSTVITMIPEWDGMRVSTMGFGHRVGMSQYGADAMATAGSDFREILQHYYKGTQIVSRSPEN